MIKNNGFISVKPEKWKTPNFIKNYYSFITTGNPEETSNNYLEE